MKIDFYRRFRTKDFEWFDLLSESEGLYACLVLNDQDRSKDFSQDPKLLKLKTIDDSIGDEYVKCHLFINTKETLIQFEEDLYYFYDRIIHQMNTLHWLFVHVDKEPVSAAKKYLEQWGVKKSMLNPADNPAYNNLSQE